VIEQQAAAVRRIGAHQRPAGEGEARIGAALGAVSIHDVGRRPPPPRADIYGGGQIGRADPVRHRRHRDAERQQRGERGEHLAGADVAGDIVDHHTDAVAALDLAAREIGDMAEQPPRGARKTCRMFMMRMARSFEAGSKARPSSCLFIVVAALYAAFRIFFPTIAYNMCINN